MTWHVTCSHHLISLLDFDRAQETHCWRWGESIRGSVETKGGTSCWAVVWNLSMPHVNVLRCPKIWQARGTPIVSIAKVLSSILETWHILKRSTSVICHGLKLQWSASGESFQLFVRFSPWEFAGFGIVWHCNMNQWVKTVSAAIGWLANGRHPGAMDEGPKIYRAFVSGRIPNILVVVLERPTENSSQIAKFAKHVLKLPTCQNLWEEWPFGDMPLQQFLEDLHPSLGSWSQYAMYMQHQPGMRQCMR